MDPWLRRASGPDTNFRRSAALLIDRLDSAIVHILRYDSTQAVISECVHPEPLDKLSSDAIFIACSGSGSGSGLALALALVIETRTYDLNI